MWCQWVVSVSGLRVFSEDMTLSVTVSGHPWPSDLMMILPNADAYARLFKCKLACLHISISGRLVCGLHAIFAFRVTGNDLKYLIFWPRALNMYIYECGKFIYSEK